MRLLTPPPDPRLLHPVAPHRQTLAQRLAAAGTVSESRVRWLVESWFAHLPPPEQADVRSRFWARDQRLALAAFWELYLHELLLRLGCQAIAHPSLHHCGRRPDFLVTRGAEAWYLEALVHAPPTEAWRSERRLYPLLDVLHHEVPEGFQVTLTPLELGTKTPPLRQLRAALRSWFASLDPAGAGEWSFVWRCQGWVVLFRATSGGEPEALPARLVTASGLRSGGLLSLTALQAKLQAKARRYGALTKPLLLAVCTSEPLAPAELAQAVQELETALPPTIVGVLAAPGLTPWTIAKTPLLLLGRPGLSLPGGLVAAFEQSGLSWSSPLAGELVVWPLFGLWPEWPADPSTPATALS